MTLKSIGVSVVLLVMLLAGCLALVAFAANIDPLTGRFRPYRRLKKPVSAHDRSSTESSR
jgi:hypothetical protein